MPFIIRPLNSRPPNPHIIDMTPDGEFASSAPPLSAQILRTAVLIAAIAGTVAVALWLALILIPVAVGAALVAYAAFRYRMWKLQRG